MSHTLHFAHANGFPSGSYRKMFAALPEDYQVMAIEKFGHSSRFPVSNNWDMQADDVAGSEHRIQVGNSFEA